MPVVHEGEIKALLADGSISAITIDTSIFDQKHIQLNSATLQALTSLKGRPFDFVMSSTVAREVAVHLERAVQEAYQSARKGIGQALGAFETKNPSRDDLLNQITSGETAQEAARRRLDKYIGDTDCEILIDTDLVDSATIFDDYFAGEPPFGSGRKKDEFPDALALNALERMASDRDTSILVVSKDGDWRAFCEKSNKLYLATEIERAMSLITDAPLGLRKAVLAWISEGGVGHKEIRQHIAYNVEQIEFTANAHPMHGEVELSSWVGELQSIVWPDEADIDIIEVDASEDEGALRVTLSLPLHLVVRVMIEMNFSFWDSVDKESIDMGGRSVEVDEDLYARATVAVDVFDLGSDNQDIVFYESELEDKYHEIELGEVNMFEPEDYWEAEEPG